jgi:hypothetical protein
MKTWARIFGNMPKPLLEVFEAELDTVKELAGINAGEA